MPGTNEDLKRAAIAVVGEMQTCRPHQLQSILQRQYGASVRAANETMFQLMRDGYLKRTFTGKLTVPK
jgi:hypothetical protein